MTPCHFRALPTGQHGAVLLAAWAPLPDDDLERGDERRFHPRPGALAPALRRAALVAAARAVCAAGCELLLPADAVVAPIVAAVAHPYAVAPTAERFAAPPRPVTVVETGGPHPEARALLAPWVAAGVVRYAVLQDGELRELHELSGEDTAHRREPGRTASDRQAVTAALLLAHRPRGAFLIESGRHTPAELARLQEHRVPVAAFAETTDDPVLAGLMRTHDPLAGRNREPRRLAWDDESSERADEARRERSGRDVPPAPPFAFAVQRQLAEWLGPEAPPALVSPVS